MLKRKDKESVLSKEQEIVYGNDNAEEQSKMNSSIQAYANAAKYFEKDIAAGEKAKARNSKRLSIFFGVLAFMAIAAVLGLTPLKTVEPFMLRVDNSSGFTDVVSTYVPDKDTTAIQNEFWLATYVRARESYNWASQDSNYEFVKQLSYDDTFTEYRNFQLSSKGYTEVLGKNRQIRTDINNIIPFKNGSGDIQTYQVRFTKNILDKNGNPDPQSQSTRWLATIAFDFKNPPKTQAERWLNPLGFGVHSYSTTQEVTGG